LFYFGCASDCAVHPFPFFFFWGAGRTGTAHLMRFLLLACCLAFSFDVVVKEEEKPEEQQDVEQLEFRGATGRAQ